MFMFAKREFFKVSHPSFQFLSDEEDCRVFLQIHEELKQEEKYKSRFSKDPNFLEKDLDSFLKNGWET